MRAFARHAPLSLATHAEPPEADRSGPPLTQGFLFTMIGAVASAHCSPELLAALDDIDAGAWYEGQLLETFFEHFEAQDPELPRYLGRNIYFMMRSQLEANGLRSVTQVLESVPFLWTQATRGDSGVWRVDVGDKRARLELEQPYNCRFEEGTILGLIDAFGGKNAQIEHAPCMRDGATCCVLEVRWDE